MFRIPGGDLFLIDVHHNDFVLRALGGDHRHGGAAHITGTDTEDAFLKIPAHEILLLILNGHQC